MVEKGIALLELKCAKNKEMCYVCVCFTEVLYLYNTFISDGPIHVDISPQVVFCSFHTCIAGVGFDYTLETCAETVLPFPPRHKN